MPHQFTNTFKFTHLDQGIQKIIDETNQIVRPTIDLFGQFQEISEDLREIFPAIGVGMEYAAKTMNKTLKVRSYSYRDRDLDRRIGCISFDTRYCDL